MKFGKEFDGFSGLKEYLKQQLEVAATGQGHAFAGEILTEGLLQMLNETRGKYMRLAQRIEAETQNDIAKYAICTTIIDKVAYNPINPTWFPVLEAEPQPYLIGEKDLWDAMDEKKTIDIQHVFIAASDEKCREILRDARSFPGFVDTDQGEIPALFSLTKSAAYRREISDLYRLFYANKIPWITLNTAYLDKFFTVRLERLEGQVPLNAHWCGVRIDYGAYSKIIDENKMPLWNVQRFRYVGENFPLPCLDSVNYEHELRLDNRARHNGFLIEPSEEIADIRYELDAKSDQSRIIVVTPKESFVEWKARKIIVDPPKKSLDYDFPILSNKIKNETNSKFTHQQIKTKNQLKHVINDLAIEKFIRFTGYELIEVQVPCHDLDDMNWFIQSELFDRRNRRVLQLNFSEVQADHYLNDAMVRFATSSVQLLVPEYRCIGIIIEKDM